jgi:hypothetical protein
MLSNAQAFALAPAAAGGAAPHFGLAEPEDHKGTLVSGSITTGAHAAVLLVLVILGWNAPPVEELIEVRIIRELPGSNEEPAPARKLIQPRQVRVPVQPAAQRVTAQAVAQPRVIKMTAEQLRLAKLNQAVAPAAVTRRQVTSSRAEARAIDTRPVSAIDLSQFDAVEIVEGLEAPVLPDEGPRQIETRAPQSTAAVPVVRSADYSSVAPFEVVTDDDESSDVALDTSVGIFAGGEGTGGTGTALGVVRCLESAFVVRYLELVRERTQQRWQIPENTPDEASVVLLFVLDSSGAATQVEFKGDAPAALGNSAVTALRSASPFPTMDDNVRCLAGEKLRGTFSAPRI